MHYHNVVVFRICFFYIEKKQTWEIMKMKDEWQGSAAEVRRLIPYVVCATHEDTDRWIAFSFPADKFYEVTDDQIGNTIEKKGIPKGTYNFVRVFAATDCNDAKDTAIGMGLIYEPPGKIQQKRLAQQQETQKTELTPRRYWIDLSEYNWP
jgi:hypothetical protein